MKELHDAIRNAAAKAANAETIEEAQQWQSVITNLTATLREVGEDEESPATVEPKADLKVENQTKGDINVARSTRKDG